MKERLENEVRLANNLFKAEISRVVNQGCRIALNEAIEEFSRRASMLENAQYNDTAFQIYMNSKGEKFRELSIARIKCTRKSRTYWQVAGKLSEIRDNYK